MYVPPLMLRSRFRFKLPPFLRQSYHQSQSQSQSTRTGGAAGADLCVLRVVDALLPPFAAAQDTRSLMERELGRMGLRVNSLLLLVVLAKRRCCQ